MLRILAGEAKGRKLYGPPDRRIRPMTARVKQHVFSVLEESIREASVLDLFSGTGSIGIEALSRGATHVTFVERSIDNVRIIQKNIDLCGFKSRCKCLRTDVFQFLKTCSSEKFQVIFADPPFRENWRERIVDAVAGSSALADGGVLVIEHDRMDGDSGKHGFQPVRSKQFGQTMLTVYMRTP